MPHIDIITFLTKFVKELTIDQFLMDNEGPEYDILPMMARGAQFDRAGIVVCQCNTEVHNADEVRKRRFLEIMNTIIDDGRYAFMVSYATVHHRFFFINIEHPICVEKYFSRFFE
uniref:Methyltransf_21 domain-containing protein n=1 Tax=Caenorhabditis japonica TaxID=281687 RepID=A0A8R1EX91_CAEJA